MADLNLNLPPELAQQQQALTRQQALAQALTAQGMQGQPQGQMVSGHYVQPSFFQQLVPLAQIYAGKSMAEEADKRAAQLAEQLRKGQEEEVKTALPLIKEGKVAEALALPSPYGGIAPYKSALIGNLIPKKTEKVQEYELAKSQGFKGSLLDWERELKKEVNAPAGQVVETPNGAVLVNTRTGATSPILVNGQPVMGKNPQTESQAKATVFHNQMASASDELNRIQNEGFNPNSKVAQTQIGMAGGYANAITPAAAQQFKQAQNQWTEAYLRFKTGAGTNAHEIEANRQTYFPVFGDSPAQINQKARMRQQAENDIAIATGRVNPIQGAISMQPIAPQQSAQPVAPTQQTPSLWGKATVVGQ